jgi:hypothetical protein
MADYGLEPGLNLRREAAISLFAKTCRPAMVLISDLSNVFQILLQGVKTVEVGK